MFDNSVFLGDKTTFAGAEFHADRTVFYWCKFQSDCTSFEDAKFLSKQTVFKWVVFSGEDTSFNGAEFHGEGLFIGGPSSEAFISDVGKIMNPQPRERLPAYQQGMFLPKENTAVGLQALLGRRNECDFSNVVVSSQGGIVFDWVDVSRTMFARTDLSKVKFLDVRWNHGERKFPLGVYRWGRWRSRLYDEVIWREQRRGLRVRRKLETEDLPQIARLYRALKTYYRDRGEYHLMGHFHYGLMDVQWHSREAEDTTREDSWLKRTSWVRRKWKKWLSWEAAYRYSSGYGEDYTWSAFILICLLILFAIGYWWLDVPSEMRGKVWWEQGLDALLYSLQAGSLGRVDFYAKPQTLAARYLHLAESIIVPVQFGLFLFSLRNRFRR